MNDDFNVSILFLIFAGVSQALSMAFGPIDVTGHFSHGFGAGFLSIIFFGGTVVLRISDDSDLR